MPGPGGEPLEQLEQEAAAVLGGREVAVRDDNPPCRSQPVTSVRVCRPDTMLPVFYCPDVTTHQLTKPSPIH